MFITIKSTYRCKLGAVALKNGSIISRGYNTALFNEHLGSLYGFYSIHAEALTIMRAKEKVDTLVVVRVLKGDFSCSYPCKKCQHMIKNAGIKKVIYFDWNGKLQEINV